MQASPRPIHTAAVAAALACLLGPGAWVLPLTAFPVNARQFYGVPGRVAIYGRGGASLGRARSHGCIGVTNRLVRWLAVRLQPGVPVAIR
jgi:hypothetical protein